MTNSNFFLTTARFLFCVTAGTEVDPFCLLLPCALESDPAATAEASSSSPSPPLEGLTVAKTNFALPLLAPVPTRVSCFPLVISASRSRVSEARDKKEPRWFPL